MPVLIHFPILKIAALYFRQQLLHSFVVFFGAAPGHLPFALAHETKGFELDVVFGDFGGNLRAAGRASGRLIN